MMKMLVQIVFASLMVISFLTPGYHGVEIIGGNDVKPHSRCYMASIQIFNNRKKAYAHQCGGTLIDRNWVLTAAHCNLEFGKNKIQVVVGAHSLKINETTKQIPAVQDKFPYPCFDKSTGENDIMLLKLAQGAKLNEYVTLLKLPNGKDVKSGTSCTVAGWGITSAQSKDPSDTLKEVKITVIDRSVCNRKDYYNLKPVITTNMICAGDKKGKSDSCVGDSGGPLLCKKKFSGIVSFGFKCADPKKPGIYTRITEDYLKWIKKTVAGVETYNTEPEILY
uniref:Granzyme K-like protein n=1 Tax=Callorhinchus milii TaxID=7868 RepID=K4G0C6_CALMI|nr:granzyme K-like protein [Callorhinchus milii]